MRAGEELILINASSFQGIFTVASTYIYNYTIYTSYFGFIWGKKAIPTDPSIQSWSIPTLSLYLDIDIDVQVCACDYIYDN